VDTATKHRRTLLIASIVVFAALFALMSALRPGVPDSVTILSGPNGARSHTWAKRYAEYAKQHGIDAEVVATAGSEEILSQLSKDEGSVVAFLQSGAEREAPDGKAPEALESLGSLYFEPNWLFVADGSGLEDMPDLAGKRVFPGRRGSDARVTARALIHVYGLTGRVAVEPFEQLSSKEAADALLAGDIDAVFLAGESDTPAVERLLRAEGVHPVSVKHAEVYRRMQPDVAVLRIPQGLFDLAQMIPRQDVRVIAPAINLVARENLHAALVDLFLDAARETHGHPTLLAPRGTFPSEDYTSLPMNADAARYYEKGPSGLRRYLPFWLATLVDRVVVYVVPFVVVVWTAFKGLPILTRFRFSLSLHGLYKRLKRIELADNADDQREGLFRELDAIEADSKSFPVPRTHLAAYFELRQNIHDLRDRLREGSG
jgi:TRAP transporter TAXI family solute receptor